MSTTIKQDLLDEYTSDVIQVVCIMKIFHH